MKTKLCLMVMIIALTVAVHATSRTCKNWFDSNGIKPNDKDCVMQCSVGSTDMGTFTCPMECDDLCAKPKVNFGKFGKFCKREIWLAAVDLRIMKEAYELSLEAARMTESFFGENGWKDESDAFRHFYWSALLSQKFGSLGAKTITDAHESCSGQNNDSDMDLHNNKLGIEAGSRYSETEWLAIAREWFRTYKFKVLKPDPEFSINKIFGDHK